MLEHAHMAGAPEFKPRQNESDLGKHIPTVCFTFPSRPRPTMKKRYSSGKPISSAALTLLHLCMALVERDVKGKD